MFFAPILEKGISDFIAHSSIIQVFTVVIRSGHYWNDQDLLGAKPERPLPAKVLRKDREEALHTSKDSPMDHNGVLLVSHLVLSVLTFRRGLAGVIL